MSLPLSLLYFLSRSLSCSAARTLFSGPHCHLACTKALSFLLAYSFSHTFMRTLSRAVYHSRSLSRSRSLARSHHHTHFLRDLPPPPHTHTNMHIRTYKHVQPHACTLPHQPASDHTGTHTLIVSDDKPGGGVLNFLSMSCRWSVGQRSNFPRSTTQPGQTPANLKKSMFMACVPTMCCNASSVWDRE